MTFVPRMMSTLATAAEHGRGEGHGTRAHADGTGHAVGGEPAEAAHAGAHVPANGGQGHQSASAEVGEARQGPSEKASETRTARTGGASSFAAELAKNVMSATQTDDQISQDDDDALEEESSGNDEHVATAEEEAPRASRARDGHAALPPAEDAFPSPHFVAPAGSGSAALPRAVVNGSAETPKSDAMPLSPRVQTGSHVHADVIANSGESAHAAVADHAAYAHSPGAAVVEPAAYQPWIQTPSPGEGHASEDAPRAAPLPADPAHIASPAKMPGAIVTGEEAPSAPLPFHAPAQHVSSSGPVVTPGHAEFDAQTAVTTAPHTSSPHLLASAALSSQAPASEVPAWHPSSSRVTTAGVASLQAPRSEVPGSHPSSSRVRAAGAPSLQAPSSEVPGSHPSSSRVRAAGAPSLQAPSSEVPGSHPSSSPVRAPAAPPAASPSPDAPASPLASHQAPSPLKAAHGPSLPGTPDARDVPVTAAPAAPTPSLPIAPKASAVGGQGASSVAPPSEAPIPRAITPAALPSRSAVRAGAVYAKLATDGAPSRRSAGEVVAPSRPAATPPVMPAAQPFTAPRSSQRSPTPAQAPADGPASDAKPTARAQVRATSHQQHPAAGVPHAELTASPAAVAPPTPSPLVAHAPVAGTAPVVAGGGHATTEAPAPVIAPRGPATPVAKADAHAVLPRPDARPAGATPHRTAASHPAPHTPAHASTSGDGAPTAAIPFASSQNAAPRRDGAVAPVQASAQPAGAHAPAPIQLAATEVAPRAARQVNVGPQLSGEAVSSAASSSASSPSAHLPTGSGVTATGESTAAHPTPLVDSSPANPPLFRLSDTRRVQAAHLDLAQQSYQPGTVATSSPSAKGFDTGKKVDKGGKSKKSRPANFAQNLTPVAVPGASPAAVTAPPKTPPAGDAVAPRAAAPVGRPARAPQPDAIHELASAGPGSPHAVGAGNAAHAAVPHAHGAAPATQKRDVPSPFAEALAPASRDSVPVLERDPKRSEDAPRSTATEPRPANQQPAPVVAADRAHGQAPLPAHAQPVSPAAPQPPVAPAAIAQAPLAAQPLYDLATADQSLHATALGKNAHLHLETGAAGPLSLHLTVQDGVADLEVEGPAVERLKMRPEELRRALAGEGLALGHFASRVNETSETRTHQDGSSTQNPNGQQQGNDDRARQADAAPRAAATPFTTQSGASSYGGEGRRHWQSEPGDPADRDRRPAGGPASGSSSSSSSDAPQGPRRGVHVTA